MSEARVIAQYQPELNFQRKVAAFSSMKKAIRPNNPRLKSNREMKDQFTLLNSLRDMRLNQDDSKPTLDLRKADVKLPEISKAMVD